MLFRSLKIVREKDTDISRQIFFREYMKLSAFKRMLLSFYGLMPLLLKSLLLIFVSLCKVMKAPRLQQGKKKFAIYWTKTEEKRCREILSNTDPEEVALLPLDKLKWRNIFYFHIFLRRRYFRMAMLLAKKHDLLIAARSMELISYYLFFLNSLKESNCQWVLACSDVNPYALGLFSAAKRLNIKTVYANHGRIHGFTPSYYCDYNLLTYIDDKKECSGKNVLHAGMKGELPRKSVDRFSEDDCFSVGIILSMTPSLSGLKNLITDLLTRFPNLKIYIKHHPIKEFNYLPLIKDLVLKRKDKVIITSGQTLEEFIEGKTFCIGANTNAHIDCLLKGVRTVYYSKLDELPFDFYGFVRDGLVPEVRYVRELSAGRINIFYDFDWEENFKKNYFSDIHEKIERLLA